MQNAPDESETKMADGERDGLGLALGQVAEVQAAIDSLELFLEGSTKLVSAAEQVSGIFGNVASRVGDATFRATFAATEGKAPREIALGLVTELSELASMSLKGANQLRRELREVTSKATAALPALLQARRAMLSLSGILKTLAAAPNRASVPPPIVIEVRAAPGALRAAGSRNDSGMKRDDPFRETTAWAWPRARRFPN